MQSTVRFSSCRGVAFEVKPHADPFAIKTPTPEESLSNKISWLGSSKVFPSFIFRSISKSSSHFCDLDPDDEHQDIDIDNLEVVEEGNDFEKQIKQSPLPLLAAS